MVQMDEDFLRLHSDEIGQIVEDKIKLFLRKNGKNLIRKYLQSIQRPTAYKRLQISKNRSVQIPVYPGYEGNRLMEIILGMKELGVQEVRSSDRVTTPVPLEELDEADAMEQGEEEEPFDEIEEEEEELVEEPFDEDDEQEEEELDEDDEQEEEEEPLDEDDEQEEEELVEEEEELDQEEDDEQEELTEEQREQIRREIAEHFGVEDFDVDEDAIDLYIERGRFEDEESSDEEDEEFEMIDPDEESGNEEVDEAVQEQSSRPGTFS